MKNLMFKVEPSIQEAFGSNIPMLVGCEEFMEYLEECGVSGGDIVDLGEFSEIWYSFLKEECAIV